MPVVPVQGYGTVTGTVTSSGAPVQGVTVSTDGPKATTTTDAQGKYTFSRLPYGTYDITASKDSYTTQTQSITVSNAVNVLNFELASSGGNPDGAFSFNAVFGGSNNDYVDINSRSLFNSRDIKLASDGTIWMCGSTASSDGDLAVPGNKGVVDAWLLNIDPTTNQILYNRTFGGTGFDEFCSLLPVDDGNGKITIWVCGNTNSSDGDLTSAGHHISTPNSNSDGWVMHIDPDQATPAAQILYNRCIGGSADDYFYNLKRGSDNKTVYLCGETLSAAGDNTGNGFHGGNNTDAWLVGIDSTQNASAPLSYNRCFGGSQSDMFNAMQLMNDGTIWCAGLTRSIDGDITTAIVGNHGIAGSADGWLTHIDPSSAVGSQILYNCCFGGSAEETFNDINVLANDTIWLCGGAASTDGNLAAAGNHGNTDAWLACVDSTTSTLKYNRCFGGSADDATYSSTRMQFAADGTIWIAAQSASTDGDLTNAGNHGGNDVWLFNVDPVANQIRSSKCYGGNGDETMPALVLDLNLGYIWVVAGTTSNVNGDVPATHGGMDLWLFNVAY